jgi:hypothetical protein
MTASIAYADTIRLRDGSILRGKVISYSERKFTIVVYIGGSQSQHVVSVDDVESVEFDGASAMARIETQGANPPAQAAPEIISPARDTTGALPRESPPVTQPSDSIQTGQPAGAQPTVNDQPTADLDAGGVPTIAEKTVSVAAAADWTSTEIRIQRGQRIVIGATGEVDLGDGNRCGPDGIQVADNRKLISTRPTGALIAVVGDDNDDFIHVGRSSEFISRHNGILFLSVNEGNLKDNAGAFVARVRVLSNK